MNKVIIAILGVESLVCLGVSVLALKEVEKLQYEQFKEDLKELALATENYIRES